MKISVLKNWKNLQDQKGFTLLEVMLSIGVLAVIMISLVEMSSSWSKAEQERLTAKHMVLVREAAKGYIMENFDAIFAATAAGPIDIPIDDDGVGPAFFLKENGVFLPATFSDTNTMKTQVTTIVRRFGTSPNRLEAVVVTAGRQLDEERMMNVARVIGESGGIVSAIDRPGTTCCTGMIYGRTGTWETALLGYDTTIWETNNNPTVAGGGYVAAYVGILTEDDLLGDYLYRTEVIPGEQAPNTMYADLNMGGFDIEEINDFVADSLVAGGALTVTGAVLIDQGLATTGNVTVTNGQISTTTLNVTGNTTIGGDVEVGTTLTATNAGGTAGLPIPVQVQTSTINQLNTADLSSVTLNMTGAGAIAAGAVQAGAATFSGGVVSSSALAGTVDVSGTTSGTTFRSDGNSDVGGALNVTNANIENVSFSNVNCTGLGC